MHFVDKYWWILGHPALNGTRNHSNPKKARTKFWVPPPSIEVQPHLVNPLTNAIDDDVKLNTKVDFWVELFAHLPFEPSYMDHQSASHIWDLDCGGDTYEEAINALYDNVVKKFGNYIK